MRVLSIFAAIALTACVSTVSQPPPSLALDPFYTQYVDADGIPVTSSELVPGEALLRGRGIIAGMLAHRPDLRAEIVRRGVRVAIMAEGETTTDLPEQRHWQKPARDDPRLTRCEIIHYDERIGNLTNRDYWDFRARGMSGELTSAGAEDILGRTTSRYYGETIFVHEFSHNVLAAIRDVDGPLYARIEAAYAAAQAEGRWHNEYALTSVDEYWAEGTQFWFNSNRLGVMDGRQILNHDDLAAYDPALYAVLGEAYGPSHRLDRDPFYMHPARVPPGPIPDNTAEVC